jgi:hypothetical protein
MAFLNDEIRYADTIEDEDWWGIYDKDEVRV